MNKQINTLDDPPKIFFWGMGQVMGFMLCFCLGGLVNAPLWGMGAGIALALAIGKTSSRHHRAFWRHIVYWFMPGNMGYKQLPESARRVYLR